MEITRDADFKNSLSASRESYFLQLSYRYGIPLTVLSGTLHLLVSQSLFVVSIDTYTWGGRETATLNKCGFSPTAMLAVMIAGVLMIVAVVGLGRYHYVTSMPLAGSCSLVISAAYHSKLHSEPGSIVSEQKLQWGINGGCVKGVRHRAYSPEMAGRLEEESFYA